jgi:glycerol kinase
LSQDVLLAIDQGTSSSRAIGFSAAGELLAIEQQSFEQVYPAAGWVEHDAELIWATVLSTTRRAAAAARGGPCAGRRRHHQPARDDGVVGSAQRRADP